MLRFIPVAEKVLLVDWGDVAVLIATFVAVKVLETAAAVVWLTAVVPLTIAELTANVLRSGNPLLPIVAVKKPFAAVVVPL